MAGMRYCPNGSAVRCPTCGADVWEDCRKVPKGHYGFGTVHDMRHQMARKAGHCTDTK